MGRHMAEVRPVEAVGNVFPATSTKARSRRRETPAARREAEPSAKSEKAAGMAPKTMAQTHVGFSIHKETGTIVMKIIDNVSREVLRQIPPEERLKLASRLKNTIGLLFEKVV